MESKVLEIHEVKEYTNNYGTTYYHNLTMVNGDKINIGKKEPVKEGDVLSYEITGDLGQHEFTKAKTLMLPPSERKDFTHREDKEHFRSSGKQTDNVQQSIIRQTCLKAACELYAQSSNNNPETVIEAAEKFEAWVNR